VILHIATIEEWAAAQATGVYITGSLGTEGFIHCSTEEQLAGTLAKHFPGRDDLVILEVDESLLDARLVYEDSYGSGAEFPHVYGPIAVAALRPRLEPTIKPGA
jgi:uncharacterized protein (DUF952 family)